MKNLSKNNKFNFLKLLGIGGLLLSCTFNNLFALKNIFEFSPGYSEDADGYHIDKLAIQEIKADPGIEIKSEKINNPVSLSVAFSANSTNNLPISGNILVKITAFKSHYMYEKDPITESCILTIGVKNFMQIDSANLLDVKCDGRFAYDYMFAGLLRQYQGEDQQSYVIKFK